MADAITAEGLVKHYGSVHALETLDLRVPEGTVLGLLGPNGAGKTTSVRILTTLLQPDAGSATVAGIDVIKNPGKVREIIGLSGQNAAVDEYLTGYENMEMFGRLYHLGKREAKARANDLLERFELADAANRPVKTYSGGMRRRLDLAGALVVSPPIIFLDEPTTGLDPRSRIGMWDVINERVRAGTTVLLTTQYLEEADQLCDDIVVIDKGREIAHGTPAELKLQVSGERLEITVAKQEQTEAVREILDSIGDERATVDGHVVTVPITTGARALLSVVRDLDERDIVPVDIGIHRASLDDVFLALTGAPAEDAGEQA
ncbi:MAG TPA: ATP-binding cassette domain-containing protein [Micromonosporaceae bacterium]